MSKVFKGAEFDSSWFTEMKSCCMEWAFYGLFDKKSWNLYDIPLIFFIDSELYWNTSLNKFSVGLPMSWAKLEQICKLWHREAVNK